MHIEYLPLNQKQSECDHLFIKNGEKDCPCPSSLWRYLLVPGLLISIFIISALTFGTASGERVPSDYCKRLSLFYIREKELTYLLAIIDSIPTTWTRFWWNTAYSPQNHTESDELWESILPSHGFVAMDREWAEHRQWPESMYLPSDHSKGVYLLEAYHQLHCLVFIEQHLC